MSDDRGTSSDRERLATILQQAEYQDKYFDWGDLGSCGSVQDILTLLRQYSKALDLLERVNGEHVYIYSGDGEGSGNFEHGLTVDIDNFLTRTVSGSDTVG